jgi:hypothetical protein
MHALQSGRQAVRSARYPLPQSSLSLHVPRSRQLMECRCRRQDPMHKQASRTQLRPPTRLQLSPLLAQCSATTASGSPQAAMAAVQALLLGATIGGAWVQQRPGVASCHHTLPRPWRRAAWACPAKRQESTLARAAHQKVRAAGAIDSRRIPLQLASAVDMLSAATAYLCLARQTWLVWWRSKCQSRQEHAHLPHTHHSAICTACRWRVALQ